MNLQEQHRARLRTPTEKMEEKDGILGTEGFVNVEIVGESEV